jgi:hypothetical protein
MNSLAAVCITDFIQPFYRYKRGKNISETIATVVTKLMGKHLHGYIGKLSF